MSDDFDDSRGTGQPGGDLPAAEPLARPRFSLRFLFIVVMAFCILLAFVMAVIRAAQREAVRISCANHVKLISLALHNYRDVHKMFPSAVTYAADGTPMHSWRVAIGPYLPWPPSSGLYDYREPWNGPNNRRLGDDIPDTGYEKDGTPYPAVSCPPWFRCPAAPVSQNQMCTNYVMLIDDRPGKPNGPPNRPGSVPPSFADKSAVIIIEIADSDIHWMEPRDVLLSELSMKINDRSTRSLSSYHGGACIAHADGSVEILNEATTEERLRGLLAQ